MKITKIKNKNKNAKFFCESCGAEVNKNARFCTNCGKFFSSVRCPNCGVTGSSEEFKNGCPSCGYAVYKKSGALFQTNNIKYNNKSNKSDKGLFNKRNISIGVKSYQTYSESLPWWIYASVLTVLGIILICLYSCLK